MKVAFCEDGLTRRVTFCGDGLTRKGLLYTFCWSLLKQLYLIVGSQNIPNLTNVPTLWSYIHFGFIFFVILGCVENAISIF